MRPGMASRVLVLSIPKTESITSIHIRLIARQFEFWIPEDLIGFWVSIQVPIT